MKKAQEIKLNVAEMSMRWICGGTKSGKAKNGWIQRMAKVEGISVKVGEKWFRHIMRRVICG